MPLTEPRTTALVLPRDVSGAIPEAKRPPGLTSRTSSLGSVESGFGAWPASAAGMSSMPKPVSGSKPRGEMSCAEERSRPKI